MDRDHDLWLYDKPNSGGLAVAITVAVACRFYSDIMNAKPDSFKHISDSIREAYPSSEGYNGVRLTCITDTVVKKV